jgi:mannan endo-1,4-beta-mannosidase
MLLLLISLSRSVPDGFNLLPDPVTPNPSSGARKLYNFLTSKFGTAMISGVMTLQGNQEDSQKENKWVHETTGKYPALIGLDFMHMVGKDTEWYTGDSYRSKQVVNDAQDYYKRGGIVALCWHWRDPSHDTTEFYSPSGSSGSSTNFDVRQAVISGTTQNQQVLRDIDIVAKELLDLQSRGVAALWRPLHEASGGWFWWGYHGAEAAKSLYKIMFDRLVNHHKLNNLIWVWTTDSASSAHDWYPGDDVVDLVGMDIYPQAGDHSSQASEFQKVKQIFNGRKIIALSECGSIPDPDQAKSGNADWSYFMPWYRDHTIPQGNNAHNSVDFWKKLMGSSFVISLEQMPGW